MTIAEELQAISEQNDGLIRPADVVEYAKNPNTALHEQFTWDNNEAAEQFRLWQARQVIRVHVTVVKEDAPPVRAFVSLYSDRSAGNGYRPIVDVMTHEDMRREYLAQALKEAHAWRKKYNTLKELAPVFDAIDHVTEMPLLVVTQLAEAAD